MKNVVEGHATLAFEQMFLRGEKRRPETFPTTAQKPPKRLPRSTPTGNGFPDLDSGLMLDWVAFDFVQFGDF